jgi:hypothetical protein
VSSLKIPLYNEGTESAEVATRDMRFSGAMIIFETK